MPKLEYLEILSAESRELLGFVDTAKSTIWRSSFFSCGDFEIYLPLTQQALDLLQIGRYVSRDDSEELGIIERIDIKWSEQDGRMMTISGRMAKSILNRRIIYRMSGSSVSPTIIRGNVEEGARSIVKNNAIACPFDSSRNMSELMLGAILGDARTILGDDGTSSEKQVTYEPMMTWLDEFLAEYGLSNIIYLDDSGLLAYKVRGGIDRSQDNTEGNEPVFFSKNFDSLISSQYSLDFSSLKNTALIGGEGEGTARFCTMLKSSASGLDRREMFVDASSSSKTYRDENDEEKTLTDAEYKSQLLLIGSQAISSRPIAEVFGGDIDIQNGSFQLGRDFNLGDIVTIQDIDIGLYMNTRIIELTEVRDDAGYNIKAKYG